MVPSTEATKSARRSGPGASYRSNKASAEMSRTSGCSRRIPRSDHVGHQRVRGDLAEATGLEVLDRLLQLQAGVHDERPVLGDRLADRLASEDEHLQRPVTRLLDIVRRHRQMVALAEHDG